MAPGGAADEVLTIRNDSGGPFTLSLRAAGTETPFWQVLRLGVWQVGTAPPDPLPPLSWWSAQASTLVTLQPGQSIRYRIRLSLPPTAGNDTQNKQAVVDFVWRAAAP
jgi:hypothetical protein